MHFKPNPIPFAVLLYPNEICLNQYVPVFEYNILKQIANRHIRFTPTLIIHVLNDTEKDWVVLKLQRYHLSTISGVHGMNYVIMVSSFPLLM